MISMNGKAPAVNAGGGKKAHQKGKGRRKNRRGKPAGPELTNRKPCEALAAQDAARASAETVSRQSKRQREQTLALAREIAMMSAPTTRSVRSDLLAVLQAVGAEFVRRYYPDANSASFSIGHFTRGTGSDWSATIPLPLAKGGA
jgi:hypothetical protein